MSKRKGQEEYEYENFITQTRVKYAKEAEEAAIAFKKSVTLLLCIKEEMLKEAMESGYYLKDGEENGLLFCNSVTFKAGNSVSLEDAGALANAIHDDAFKSIDRFC